MADVTIKVRENGPYQIIGRVKLVDADGNEIPIPDPDKVFLCRCGGSSSKPFCDGTHKTTGWLQKLQEHG
ncbi:MAG: CDGSH iron-sulfur domain-containing protein [Chthonomonadales bacterium]